MKKHIGPNHWLRSQPIAHRGLHDNNAGRPENSLASFEYACKKGFPIELDVRITLDGQAIVYHDFNLKRLTGINKWVSNVSASSLTKIKILDTTEHIPLLKEVLELVNGRVPILIEIKRNFLPGIFENAVIKSLRDYKGEFAILSFNPVALRYIHNRAPEYISGINIGRAEKFFFQTNIFNKFINSFSFPDFISYSMNGSIPTYSASYYRNNGLPILAWTVSSKEIQEKAKSFADNIIFENFIPE